jgi:hypothetical protein
MDEVDESLEGRHPLAGEEVADDVRKAILKPKDQAPALSDLIRLGPVSFEPAQFGNLPA